MNIHLDSDIFELVANGTKNIEVRINDEKRRNLKIGDNLIFIKRPEEKEKIYAIVTDLVYYNNFDELVNDYNIEILYLKDITKDNFVNNILSRFYTKEQQDKYGVVAIHFKKK